MSATVTPTSVTAHDRLGIMIFLAIALHAAVILGITFTKNREGDAKQDLPTLDVTLVTSAIDEEPEKADYLAQSNQLGAGNTEEKVRPQAPPDAAPAVSPGQATPPATPPAARRAAGQRVVSPSRRD